MRTTDRTPRLTAAANDGRVTRPRRIDSRTKKLTSLTHDVQRLRLHIARLEELRALLQEKTMSRADSTMGSISKLIRMYFEVFAHGFHSTVKLPGNDNAVETTSFLRSIMDEDVLGGGFRGVDTMIENGKRFNTVFNHLELQLTDVTVVPLEDYDDGDGRVVATATVTHRGHVTLKTLEVLFPHVLADAALVMSILGRPVTGDGRTTFVYDIKTSRIVSSFIDIDMVGTFATVVSNPHDLDVLFNRARITPDGFIGDRDEIPADKAVSPTVIEAHRVAPHKAMAIQSILSTEDEADSIDHP